MSTSSLNLEIKKSKSNVFRRLFIKRRTVPTGLFEDNWQEISSDVTKWGSIKQSIDSVRLNKFRFGNASIKLNNVEGRFNPEDDEASLWFGYANQQRTLVKIEAGYVHSTQTSGGIWKHYDWPAQSLFDVSQWDEDLWDSDNTVFTGLVSGDVGVSDKNEVTFKIKPLNQVFKDYAAQNIGGYDTSMTASKFMTLARDHTDSSGNFVFRPFFGNTITTWNITSTDNIYSNLDTSTAEDVIDSDVWAVMEKLAEAENFVVFINSDGVFNFRNRDAASTVTTALHGVGNWDGTTGHTIKNVKRYGPRVSKYYSRVQVKYDAADTATSYVVQESALEVSSANNAWLLGERTFNLDNVWIPDTATAQTIANVIFNDYSSMKKEIDFEATFLPQLSVFDRVTISYDTNETPFTSLWDLNDWAADDTSVSTDLIWDPSIGDAIRLVNSEFKLISLSIDLDKFSTKIIGREV